MPKPFAATALALLLCAVVTASPGPAAASENDTQQMIEALMPTATRSLRNLVVRQKPEAAAVAASAASAAVAAVAPAAVSPASAAPPAAAPAPPAAPAGPAPSLALSIQFEPNSARVRAESGPLLGSLVAALQSPELKGNRFIIEGHADARGAAERNLRLSQERADEVRLYLVALGVHPSRLRAVGRGVSQPLNASDPAAAENRRVRVVTVE
jgi:outer membrane protein OmpA-like peptidoglycan-associated protein